MTINVEVRLLGVFRGLTGKSHVSLKLEKPNVRDVVQTLAEMFSAEIKKLLIDPELGDPRINALILVNGKEINVLEGLETEIEAGDEVTLIPVSHGG